MPTEITWNEVALMSPPFPYGRKVLVCDDADGQAVCYLHHSDGEGHHWYLAWEDADDPEFCGVTHYVELPAPPYRPKGVTTP